MQKRVKPWGGRKTAPPALLEAAKRTYFQPGRANHRKCQSMKVDGTPCTMLAFKGIKVCGVHGGFRLWARQGKLQPSGRRQGPQSIATDGRAPISRHTVRTDAAVDVPEGGRLDEDAVGEGLDQWVSGLREPNSSIKSTRKKLYERLRLKAEQALSVLIDAPGVPANVRSAAIRTALELVGAIGVRSKDQRNTDEDNLELDPERLTIEDIDREIGKLGRV